MRVTNQALDQLLRAVGDPIADLRAIAPGHPEFLRAQVVRAAAGVLAKTSDALPALADALRATNGFVAPPRTHAHLAAAAAWVNGDPVRAAEQYAAILEYWPHDVLALRLAQSCYFFLGRHAELCAVVDRVWPAWNRGRKGFAYVLAMASFAYAENGDAAYAEALGREALRSNPACPMGVHAVAHAIAQSGRHRFGAGWMRDQIAQWGGDSRMRTHNAWHLAMFDAECGNVDSALGILDTWLLPASARSPLDACDAAALLWRLTADGIAGEGRWGSISDAFERAWTPGFWPYVDLHAGLAHFRAGRPARATGLMHAIDALALGSDYAASRARRITQPGLQALRALAERRTERAAYLFAELQPVLSEAGGSEVQLDLFRDLGRQGARPQIASQRIPRRPPSIKEQEMPLINVKLIEGVFSESQKKEIAKSLTEAMVKIEGEAMRSVTWCVVEEVKSGDWAIGGTTLTTADVKAIAARKAA